jgi:hypothetical protein
MNAWEPLEPARAFLVKRGAYVDIQALHQAFPGALFVLTTDMEAVRPIGGAEREPLDRLAGMISEE